MGLQHFFYTMYDDRDLIVEVLDRRTTWYIEVLPARPRAWAPTFLVMGDDVAFQGQKPLSSPRRLQGVGHPLLPAHCGTPWDMPVFLAFRRIHRAFIGDGHRGGHQGHAMHGAAGRQRHGPASKKKYGDKLVLLGNVDAAWILTTTDLDAVRGRGGQVHGPRPRRAEATCWPPATRSTAPAPWRAVREMLPLRHGGGQNY